jgi:hypothetical protein
MGLNEDFEIVFSSGTAERLFIDPVELSMLFPEASAMEVFELVRLYSEEMQTVFRFGPDEPIPVEVQEYVKAATACALMRLYNFGGQGGADALSIRLGDLQVDNSKSNNAPITKLNASNWCELAAALREELMRINSGAGMKAIMKGSRYPNPMPCRQIRSKEWYYPDLWGLR